MPDVTALFRRLRRLLNPSGPGSWIYRRQRLAWMNEPALNRQLPFFFRLLALYCAQGGRLPGGNSVPSGNSGSLGNKIPLGDKVPLGDKAFALASALTRWFSQADHAAIESDGFTLCLDLSDPRCLQVVGELRPDHPVSSHLSPLLNPGDTFIDVGANHGTFSLLASKAVGPDGRVVAIEPNPRLAKLVARSLELSHLCPFQVLAIACGDQDGDIDFFIPRNSSGAAGRFAAFSGQDHHQQIRVALRRFDDAIDWRDLPGRVVLKLDVEGSEYAFLKGAAQMIRCRRPDLVIEFNPTSLKAARIEPLDLIQLLIDLGYESFSALAEPSTTRSWDDLDILGETNLLLVA